MIKLTNKKIKDLVKIGQEFNLKRLKIDNMEIEFFDKKVGVPQGLKLEDIPKDKMPTEDQLLYWSSGYDPEEARKEDSALEKALKN